MLLGKWPLHPYLDPRGFCHIFLPLFSWEGRMIEHLDGYLVTSQGLLAGTSFKVNGILTSTEGLFSSTPGWGEEGESVHEWESGSFWNWLADFWKNPCNLSTEKIPFLHMFAPYWLCQHSETLCAVVVHMPRCLSTIPVTDVWSHSSSTSTVNRCGGVFS